MNTPPPSPAPVAPHPRRRRRWPFVLAAVVLLVFVLPLAFVAWRLDAWVQAAKNDAVADLETRLGRKATIGTLRVRLFGNTGAEVRDVVIAADPKLPAEKAPLFTLSRAAIDVGVLRTLLTFGKRPTVEAVEIQGVTVNVVRFADGTTNVDQVLRRLRETAPEKAEPMSPATQERVRNGRIDSLRMSDLRVVFTDLVRQGAKAEISDVDLAIDGASLADDWTMKLTAAVLAARKNLDVAARFGAAAAAADGDLGSPALRSLNVKMARTDVAPLLPFLLPTAGGPGGASGASLETAALTVDLNVDAPGATTATKGHVLMTGMRFPGGQAFDTRLDLDLRAEAAAGNVDIGRLSLTMGEMSLDARGKLFALRTAPRFEAFRLSSRGLDFDTLRRYYPTLDTAAGMELHGPFSVQGSASGETGQQQFEGRVDLSAASLEVPELFQKPAGTTLAVTTRGTATGDTVTLERLMLEVVDWRLRVQGVVKNLSTATPHLDLTARTDAPTLGGLLRLLPPVAKAIPSGRPLGGSLIVDATAKGTTAAMTATMKAALTGLDVRVPDAWLNGSAGMDVRADVRGRAPSQVVTAKLSADLDKLEIIYADVLRKTAGTPLSFTLDVDRRGAAGRATTKQTFDAHVAGMRARGTATLIEKGESQSFDVAAEADPFSLPAVLALTPGSGPAGLGPLRIGGKLRARGTSNQPASLHVELPSFTASAGKSDLRGKMSFSNPERPVVSLDASSKYLDLDDFLPARGQTPPTREGGAKEPRTDAETAKRDAMLKTISGTARLNVDRGRAERIDYQNLRADLKLEGGRAVARGMEVDVFGGHFSGTGTELPLAKDGGPFAAKGKMTNIDVDAVLTRFAELPGLLRGRLDADLQLAGDGIELIELKKTLEGLLAGTVRGAELGYGTLLDGVRAPLARAIEVPALAKLFGGADGKVDLGKQKSLGDLATAVRFEAGAMRLTKPLAATTPQGPLALDGRITLDGKADLQGTWTLNAAAASALAGNRVKMTEPLPVKLQITGSIERPTITVANAADLARAYVVAFGQSAAGQALQENARRGVEAAADRLGVKAKLPEGGVAGMTDEAKKREEAARAEADRLRQQAEAQRQKAEDEARRRAEEAKKSAKDRLKGVLGR